MTVAIQLTAAETYSSLAAPTQLTAAVRRSSLTVALAKPGQSMGDALFARYMFATYSSIAAWGLPNYMRARIPVLTNLNLKSWA